ncbi:NAC domain-containing protein 1-like [Phragmites australis]|uniref:NAC domain-containing protein 1-like n=1 Tax=Phragmites australis TaxID=29695 RepID=UPI002D778DEA|nr:NAC domain-containing protein 1-like [Phragmites australis]
MAEQDKQKGRGGGGDEEKEDKYPIGFRFKPKDVELIEYYLLPRLQGRPSVPNDAIIEANVYECHPDALINEKYRSRGEGEWFFLSPRARMYQNGVRPSRKTEDSWGRWKALTATKLVAKERVGESKTKFCKTVLNYFVGSPKNERKTKWLMRELTIPEYEIKLDKTGPNNTLDEYVICRIYVSPVHKGNDDEASTSSVCEEAQQSQGTAESKLSDRQAGKLPVEKQTQRRGGPRK